MNNNYEPNSNMNKEYEPNLNINYQKKNNINNKFLKFLFILFVIGMTVFVTMIFTNNQTKEKVNIDYSKYLEYEVTKLEDMDFYKDVITYKSFDFITDESPIYSTFYIENNELFVEIPTHNLIEKIDIKKPKFLFPYNDGCASFDNELIVFTENDEIYSLATKNLTNEYREYDEDEEKDAKEYIELLKSGFRKIDSKLKIKEAGLMNCNSEGDTCGSTCMIFKDQDDKLYSVYPDWKTDEREFVFNRVDDDFFKSYIYLGGFGVEKDLSMRYSYFQDAEFYSYEELENKPKLFLTSKSNKNEKLLYKVHFITKDTTYIIDQERNLYDLYSEKSGEYHSADDYVNGIEKVTDKKVAAYGIKYRNNPEFLIIFEDGSEKSLTPPNDWTPNPDYFYWG